MEGRDCPVSSVAEQLLQKRSTCLLLDMLKAATLSMPYHVYKFIWQVYKPAPHDHVLVSLACTANLSKSAWLPLQKPWTTNLFSIKLILLQKIVSWRTAGSDFRLLLANASYTVQSTVCQEYYDPMMIIMEGVWALLASTHVKLGFEAAQTI